jgi:hypothetical protein
VSRSRRNHTPAFKAKVARSRMFSAWSADPPTRSTRPGGASPTDPRLIGNTGPQRDSNESA